MRHLLLATFSVLIILASVTVSSGQGSSPASPAATSSEEGSKPLYDLARVNGLDNYTGPEEGKALLASRGLLISPETNKQLFNFYNESPPYFITTDTALHIYRMILEKNFKQLERRQSGNLGRFLERAWKLLAEGRESDRARSQVQWPAAPRLRAATMAAVALRLLKPDWKPSGEAAEALYAKIAANVEAELKLIAAGSPSSSPLFGQTVDYSLLTPRGFYAGEEALERFFRARQFVATPLNLDDDGLLQVAAIWGVLCNDFNYTVHMTEPYRQLLGADNVPSVLTILDIFGRCGSGISAMESDSKVRRIVEGRGLSEARQALRAGLPPQLVPIGADLQQVMTEAHDDPDRRPLRVAVWPQLAMPDAAMMSRCVWPHVPAARQPSGLDVLACVGNDRALSLLLSMTGEANRKPLERAVLDVRARRHRLFRPLVTRDGKLHDVWRDPLGEDDTPGPLGWSEAANGAMWAGMEQVISALGKPAVTSRHPRFMATTAYADKSINTALAGWAGHRHTFVLHAPPMGICGCASVGTPTGYVEPNLPFWTAMDDLALRTYVWLNKRGQRDNNMLALVELCKRARTIAEKQLAAVALSAEDNQWIKDYGTLMTGLCGYHPDIRDYDDECGFVVDIASDRQTDEVVYVGTGRPRAIYVIMDYGGRLQLARGGVLSYREFSRPLAEGRMTNARWDEMLSAGREAPAPDWLTKLGVDYTQQGIIEAIRDGRVSAEVLKRHASREIAEALLESCLAHTPAKSPEDRTAVMLAWRLSGLMDSRPDIIDLSLVKGYVAWAEKYPWRIERLPQRAEFVDYYLALADRWSKADAMNDSWLAVGRALALIDSPAARVWLKGVLGAEPGKQPRALANELAHLGRDKLPEAALEAVTDYFLAELDRKTDLNWQLMRLWPYWSAQTDGWEVSLGGYRKKKLEPQEYPAHLARIRIRVVAGLQQYADRTAAKDSLWEVEAVEHLARCLGPAIMETALAERVNKLPLARRYAGQEEKETGDDVLLKR